MFCIEAKCNAGEESADSLDIVNLHEDLTKSLSKVIALAQNFKTDTSLKVFCT